MLFALRPPLASCHFDHDPLVVTLARLQTLLPQMLWRFLFASATSRLLQSVSRLTIFERSCNNGRATAAGDCKGLQPLIDTTLSHAPSSSQITCLLCAFEFVIFSSFAFYLLKLRRETTCSCLCVCACVCISPSCVFSFTFKLLGALLSFRERSRESRR